MASGFDSYSNFCLGCFFCFLADYGAYCFVQLVGAAKVVGCFLDGLCYRLLLSLRLVLIPIVPWCLYVLALSLLVLCLVF